MTHLGRDTKFVLSTGSSKALPQRTQRFHRDHRGNLGLINVDLFDALC
jgi:hypothetical protein